MKKKEKERAQQEEVECELEGPDENGEVLRCGKKMPRSELSHHEKTCPLREYECKFCKKVSTYAAITGQSHTEGKPPKIPPEMGHYAECPDYPLSCRNKCTATGSIRRTDMDQHLTECPLEYIPCERWDEGCKEMVQRKEMAKHMKAYKKEHRELIWAAYIKNREENRELKKELASTKVQLVETRKELDVVETNWKTAVETLESQEVQLQPPRSCCTIL